MTVIVAKPFRYSLDGFKIHDYTPGEAITYEPAIEFAKLNGLTECTKAPPQNKAMSAPSNKAKKASGPSSPAGRPSRKSRRSASKASPKSSR